MRVHDSQANGKMDVTRERISHILELREILLSFQTGFSLVNAAVVCAVLESISGLEPSSVLTESRYDTLQALIISLPCITTENRLVRLQALTTPPPHPYRSKLVGCLYNARLDYPPPQHTH